MRNDGKNMGWTSLTRSRDESDREFFAREFSCCQIVDFSKVGNVAYMVLERIEMPGKRFALVCLTEWDSWNALNFRYFNFRYKDISEEMGPCESNCPVRLLDKLSPTDSEYANNWRQRCRENASSKANGRKRIKSIVVGAWFKLRTPLKFSDKTMRDTFKVVLYRGRKAYQSQDGKLYRIRGLEKYEFEILKPQVS